MNRIAIAFTTCDRTELTRRSVEPLLQPDKFDLHWFDGSRTVEGRELQQSYDGRFHAGYTDVRGGSGAAIVCALTALLAEGYYQYIGLVENDVLLPHDWFDKTFALFEQGRQDGLTVGAVSARAYEDRVLIQRDCYAVMHNLGAGMIIFTREVAQLVLDTYRTQWTTENRHIFSQLAGVDIGSYWAFRGSEHWLCADWRWDAVLASHGFASLALTPSPVEMIGQNPPLAEQGLTLVSEPVSHGSNNIFKRYCGTLASIREGRWQLPDTRFFRDANGFEITFPHQIMARGGIYEGDWRLKDVIGFGPFGWMAGDPVQEYAAGHGDVREEYTRIIIPVLGSCEFMLGAKEGGQVRIIDAASGFDVSPTMGPEQHAGALTVNVPGSMLYRDIMLTALTPGVTFYGLRTSVSQPVQPQQRFTYATLPPVGGQ